MWAYCQQVKQALGDWSRRYISDEDPDERRSRLRQQALEEDSRSSAPGDSIADRDAGSLRRRAKSAPGTFGGSLIFCHGGPFPSR